MTCINCGHEVVEAYCARCGQRRRHGRFSLGPLLREVADAIFNLDRGLLRTAVDLSRRPGAMVREYLAGRTRPYTNPAKYLILCAALTTFVSLVSGFSETSVEAAIAANPEASENLTQWFDFTQRYFNLMLLLGLPILPFLSRLLFRSVDVTLTEHLIFNTYVYAQQSLFFIVLLPTFLLWGIGTINLLYFVSVAGYYTWACRGFFRLGLFSTLVRATVVMALFMATFSGGMAVAAILVMSN